MQDQTIYQPKNNVRIVTAASLFDGHDAAINIMRRIIQRTGAEVIHLGHNRSVDEIVNTAIQEDANAIAITSYQGGHTEFLKYMYDLLKERKAGHIKIFAGGGGTILPEEIAELENYGIAKIYSPDDGRAMGLQGMINHLVENSDYPTGKDISIKSVADIKIKNDRNLAELISAAENFEEKHKDLLQEIRKNAQSKNIPILGITGTGGAGKSSLVDELVRRFLNEFTDKQIAIISVDPTKKRTGGALLGDRIRMNAINNPRVYMRSMATRASNVSLSGSVQDALNIVKNSNFDLIILETSGIGQSDTQIVDYADVNMYVMTPEYGAATQLEKIDMLDYADIIALNKFDKRGALDALRDVKKQYQRNHNLFDQDTDKMPAFGTIASQFNDPGVNTLYKRLIALINEKTKAQFDSTFVAKNENDEKQFIIPPQRVRYLSEIVENNRKYHEWADKQSEIAQHLYSIYKTIEALATKPSLNKYGIDDEIVKICQNDEKRQTIQLLLKEFDRIKMNLHPENWEKILQWPNKVKKYKDEVYTFKVRDKEIHIDTHTETLSHLKVPKISLPKYKAWGDLLQWILKENVPGEFPYAAGLYPFKRTGEDPTRMFAGEGTPERTNRRFHYVSLGMPAKRLSTAFDSVTLYGNDPDIRPDIYGKIGNSGVSICCLDDAKKLYSGFDLSNPKTSVSMTINGPAPMMLAFFMNAAIDQNVEKYLKENDLTHLVEAKLKQKYDDRGIARPKYQGDLPEGNDGLGLMLLGVTGDEILDKETYDRIKYETITQVRGTIQADILKEDQAQNTCIFSTEFSLRLMGDIQEYFIAKKIRNFYSVSISGYHIAEAGANPISQLAFTLANGFTYVEYYLSRGMDINKFAPNLSFFFSNGMDAEYSVIGRVARRIWAKAMKEKYGANARSQMLKYHIQTSGRSLHAQEIDFNDIRTTLQALYAIYDNTNSLHTNAYDEAITTPTEESVRRAMAIQWIINKELGLATNENPIQGSFIIEELTELVEEAIYAEFDRITERGGVLGAMETMYQRSKIQEESLYYETLKHTGKLPIIGVNTFLGKEGSKTQIPGEIIRATEAEKKQQIDTVQNLYKTYEDKTPQMFKEIQEAAIHNKNIFEALMEAGKVMSLGQMTSSLFEVGGQYRRNM
jgi:methylmalonyl-CoA mutase